MFYRGFIDVFYRENLGCVVTDFKTSSKPIEKGTTKEKKYKLQIGGYAVAVEEMFEEKNIKVNKASILVVPTKSAILQEVVCEGEELSNYKEEFKNLCVKWHNENGQGFLFQ